MSGVDLATVREILRHKSISMTLRYAHLAPEHKKAAVDALSNALGGETGDMAAGTKTA
jgi:site-specific recombinase XerD